jgi:antitoxin CptB
MAYPARLNWLCRRGTKELDLLLQTWLTQEFERSTEAEQQVFLRLLDWQDDKLGRLLVGQDRAADAEVDELGRRIRALSVSRP